MNVTVGAPPAEGDEAVVFLNVRGTDLPSVFGLNQGVFRVTVDNPDQAADGKCPGDVAQRRAGGRGPRRFVAQAAAVGNVRR